MAKSQFYGPVRARLTEAQSLEIQLKATCHAEDCTVTASTGISFDPYDDPHDILDDTNHLKRDFSRKLVHDGWTVQNGQLLCPLHKNELKRTDSEPFTQEPWTCPECKRTQPGYHEQCFWCHPTEKKGEQ